MVQAKQMCSSTFMVIRRQRRVLWFCGALGNLSAALAKYNTKPETPLSWVCAGIRRGLYYSYVDYQCTNAVTQVVVGIWTCHEINTQKTTPQKKQDPIPEMPKTMSVVLLTIAFVVISLGVLLASLKKVPTTEMGVQYNVHKKQVRTWYCLFHCHVYIPKLKHTPFTPFSS